MPEKSSDEQVLGDLKLQDLNDIFREVAPYLGDPADPLLASFTPGGVCVVDYDNSTNLQFYYYARRTGKKTNWGWENFWEIRFTYEETKSDDFDYETKIKETVITHKRYMNDKETIWRMARFKLASMDLTPQRKETRNLVYQDILGLRERGRYFAEATSTLENWASAALDMQVTCLSCWKQSLIKGAAIREFAEAELDLAKLREKLTCSKCGKNSPFIKAVLAFESPFTLPNTYSFLPDYPGRDGQRH